MVRKQLVPAVPVFLVPIHGLNNADYRHPRGRLSIPSRSRHDSESFAQRDVQELEPGRVHRNLDHYVACVARAVVVAAIARNAGPATFNQPSLAVLEPLQVLHSAPRPHVVGQIQVGSPRKVKRRRFHLERLRAHCVP